MVMLVRGFPKKIPSNNQRQILYGKKGKGEHHHLFRRLLIARLLSHWASMEGLILFSNFGRPWTQPDTDVLCSVVWARDTTLLRVIHRFTENH